MNTNRIDLLKFCGTEDVRYYLNQPWSEGEHTYASNGHVIVRVPVRSEFTKPDHKMVGRGAKIFTDNPPGGLIAIPELPPIAMIPCDECEHGCVYCDNGFCPKMQWVAVGDTQFMNHYLHLVASLPNPLISPNGNKAAPFTFDGGDGLLMPCRKF